MHHTFVAQPLASRKIFVMERSRCRNTHRTCCAPAGVHSYSFRSRPSRPRSPIRVRSDWPCAFPTIGGRRVVAAVSSAPWQLVQTHGFAARRRGAFSPVGATGLLGTSPVGQMRPTNLTFLFIRAQPQVNNHRMTAFCAFTLFFDQPPLVSSDAEKCFGRGRLLFFASE